MSKAFFFTIPLQFDVINGILLSKGDIMARILIVEDEILINELLCKNLTLVGHKCACAFDGAEALECIKTEAFDLLILDVMLPEVSGFDIIKQAGNVPVIFVTAKNDLKDRMKGFTLGADDYIVKPFEMPELLARVQAVLRRTKRDESFMRIDDLLIDFESRKTFLDGKEIELTPKEFALLDTLITNRNIVLSRERLLELVWSYYYEGDTTRTVDVHIQQLRQKLNLKSHIKSVYGVGYRFEL